jgi:hypothetical protein
MGDAAIQGYIQDLIQADSNFDDADVTLGDFRVLDRGSAPYAVILPGRIVSGARSGDWSQVRFVWEFPVEVYEDFIDDSYADFSTARQAVVDAIGKHPTLNGQTEIVDAYVSEAGLPQYVYGGDGGDVPQFVFSRVTVRVVEDVSYDGSGEFTT